MNPAEMAERYLEANDFARAVVAFREAVSSGAVPEVPRNLSIAEALEAVEFLRSQHGASPASEDLSLALAHAYVRASMASHAVSVCGAWLARSPEADPTRVRLVRYEAALTAGQWAPAREDFEFLWSLGDRSPRARSLRKTLLRAIAALERESAAALLEELGSAHPDEAPLREFLRQKRLELQLLGAASV